MTEEIMNNNNVFDYSTNKAWYIVHTRSRQEEIVKERLEARRESMGVSDQLYRVVIPYDVTTEIKGGKVVESKKKIFPGYVFVEMIMTDYAWYVVRNTKDVSGFIGSSGKGAKPTPVKDNDMLEILARSGELPDNTFEFTEGDTVKILSGAFAGSVGVINNTRGSIAIININLFDRIVPLEVEFSSLQKVAV